MLKEGHLAGEEKGIRNPLLWVAFKWGEIPTHASILQGPCGATQKFPHCLMLYFLRLCGQHRSGFPPAPTCFLASFPFLSRCS